MEDVRSTWEQNHNNYNCNIYNFFNYVSVFNPLTPRSDQHETSPHNILISPSKQVMRIFKLII